jgi:hypothetical protein
VILQEELESAYNAKVQQSKNSLNWWESTESCCVALDLCAIDQHLLPEERYHRAIDLEAEATWSIAQLTNAELFVYALDQRGCVEVCPLSLYALPAPTL